jgi:cyclohexadienyl dehydratase
VLIALLLVALASCTTEKTRHTAAPSVSSNRVEAGSNGANESRSDAATSSSPDAGIVRYGEPAALAALADAIEARMALMQAVAAAKWLAHIAVLDPAREQAVLDSLAAQGAALGFEPQSVRAFFSAQIDIARSLQERDFEAWRRAGACTPCASAPKLADLRARIDALGKSQLAALYVVLPREAVPADIEQLRTRIAFVRQQHHLTQAQADALDAGVLGIRRTPSAATLERLRAVGVLRIATTGDYAPFSFEAQGRLEGADIVLAQDLARALALRPVFVRTRWQTLLDDLRADRFDVALSGISGTAERAAVGALSTPYQAGGKTIVARCNERERYDTLPEVDQPGVRVVVNPGGTNERFDREHLHAATILVHPDNRTIFEEILAGRADVMITDDVEADLQALRHPGALCRTLRATLTNAPKQILMAPTPELQTAVDRWLAGAIAAGVPRNDLEAAMRRFASERDSAP